MADHPVVNVGFTRYEIARIWAAIERDRKRLRRKASESIAEFTMRASQDDELILKLQAAIQELGPLPGLHNEPDHAAAVHASKYNRTIGEATVAQASRVFKPLVKVKPKP